MAEEKFETQNINLCLQKIKDFLGDPQSDRKKAMAEKALESLSALFDGKPDYVLLEGCKSGIREN